MKSICSCSNLKHSLCHTLYLYYVKYTEKDIGLCCQFDDPASKKYFRYYLQKSECIAVSTSITMQSCILIEVDSYFPDLSQIQALELQEKAR
jgi:hypothetical protein